jgi:hypothetical protein
MKLFVALLIAMAVFSSVQANLLSRRALDKASNGM